MAAIDRFKAHFETLGEPRRGFFTRGVPLEFQATPLSAIGSKSAGGRYNPASAFEVYYLGDTADTVARETRMVILDAHGRPIAQPHAPKIVMTIDYDLQRLVDLTNPDILKQIRVSRKSILTEWKDELDRGHTPLTHELGIAAYEAGIEGLIVPSARNRHASNIAVIKDNMFLDSYIEIHDPRGFGPTVTTRVDGHKPH